MTRKWVRTDLERLSDVVATYYRVGRNAQRTAEELDCSTANVYYLLRRAAEAGLIHPKPRRKAVPVPTSEPIGKPVTDGGDAPFSEADDE